MIKGDGLTSYDRVYRPLNAPTAEIKSTDAGHNHSISYGFVKSIPEIRLDSVLDWHDSIRQGLEAKLKESYIAILKQVLSYDEKMEVYHKLRLIAAAYKSVGDHQECDRHLEAAEFLRRKFEL